MASFRAAQVLYERACRARGYKESTINTAMANLKPFFSFIRDRGIADLRDVRRSHIVSFLEASEATHAKNTRRGMLISIRRLFRVLYEQKKIIMLPTGHLSLQGPPDCSQGDSFRGWDEHLPIIDRHKSQAGAPR